MNCVMNNVNVIDKSGRDLPNPGNIRKRYDQSSWVIGKCVLGTGNTVGTEADGAGGYAFFVNLSTGDAVPASTANRTDDDSNLRRGWVLAVTSLGTTDGGRVEQLADGDKVPMQIDGVMGVAETNGAVAVARQVTVTATAGELDDAAAGQPSTAANSISNAYYSKASNASGVGAEITIPVGERGFVN